MRNALFYKMILASVLTPALILGIVPVVGAAWWNPFADGKCLEDVTNAAITHQTCLVHQVLPGQCRAPATVLRTVKQTCAKDVGDTKKVVTAEKTGRRSVKGDPKKSAFKRISRSLERSPYFIPPERANFEPFTKNCSKSTTSYYKIGAYHLEGDAITFIVYPLGFKCADKRSISEKFPIVTKQQLFKLRSGAYVKTQPAGMKPFRTAAVVETTSSGLKSTYRRVAEGKKPKPKQPPTAKRKVKPTKGYNLQVITSPEDAQVRIVNIKSTYTDDIVLAPGKYLLEVSAPGYQTRKQWVKIGKSDHSINIALARENYRATRDRSCEKHAGDIEVSTVRIAPFNECHFITYPDERSRDLAITNRRESGYIHDVRLEVTYYDDERNPINKEQYVVFPAAKREAVAPGETRFPFTGIYLKRDGVHAIGIKTIEFAVSK